MGKPRLRARLGAHSHFELKEGLGCSFFVVFFFLTGSEIGSQAPEVCSPDPVAARAHLPELSTGPSLCQENPLAKPTFSV